MISKSDLISSKKVDDTNPREAEELMQGRYPISPGLVFTKFRPGLIRANYIRKIVCKWLYQNIY